MPNSTYQDWTKQGTKKIRIDSNVAHPESQVEIPSPKDKVDGDD